MDSTRILGLELAVKNPVNPDSDNFIKNLHKFR